MNFFLSIVVGLIVVVGAVWIIGAAAFTLFDWATELSRPQSNAETDDEIDHRFY